MAIVVSHNEIFSKERIIVTYHPIGKKKKIYSLFCLKKSGGCYTKPNICILASNAIMANLCFDRIRPSAEKHLSASTLVAGIAKYFLANLTTVGYFPFRSRHQRSGSTS